MPHSSEESATLSESPQRDFLIHADKQAARCLQGDAFAPNWFAVYTSPRHEKRVDHYMKLKEIEHFLPLYRAQHKWSSGETVALDLPLFPGYLFVRITRPERVRVLEVPGVLSVVGGTGRQLAPLPDTEIDALRSGLPLRNAEPHPLLTVGQRVRIRSGALCGMVGVVVRLKNSLRVVLTMDLIMQSVAVEVDGTELEPLDPALPSSSGSRRPWSVGRAAGEPFGGNKKLSWP
jgi:transcription antitermination factor NusG